ncbi:hypothetical protein [Halococcus sediminicola]|uniref:hypothetical protein n=1 Tax=Halococcus sediminicola TaxID=1264579 RepID=UPI00067914B1|nr:hypothetical protein [Halococcus sediminicola]
MNTDAVKTFYLLLIFISTVSVTSAASPSSPDSTNQTGPAGNPVELEWRDGTLLYQPNWTSNGATFTFESKIPTSLTIVDMNSIGDSGSGDVATKTIRLTPNEQKTVQMDLNNEAGSLGVTISNGKQMKYTSNPQKPLFEQIFRWMLYAPMIIMPIEIAAGTIGIIWARKRNLKKKPVQVV